MKNKSIVDKRRSHHFTEIDLNADLQFKLFGHQAIYKSCSVGFSTISALVSGFIASFLGTGLENLISNPNQFGLSILANYLCIAASLLTILTWIVESIRSHPSRGIHKGASTGLITFSIAFFIAKAQPNYSPSSFFTVLVFLFTIILISATLATFFASIAFGIGLILGRKTKNHQIFFILLTISCSFIANHSIGGILTAVVITTIGYWTSLKAKKFLPGFQSLQQFILLLACWRGTSFRDLDLSGINFSGSTLANCDFRARRLYRTCLQNLHGLDRSRLDDRYLDLTQPKVQQLLTQGESKEQDFSRVNLQGAYLQGANLQKVRLYETNLNGADLKNAQLQDAQFIRTIATGVDFRGANLTGACIKDWSINRQTEFDGVLCDYIYRGDEQDQKGDRYPGDRNFAPGEFAALIRQLSSTIELVFEREPDLQVLNLTFEKFRLEDSGLGLELASVEPQGDHWIVKVIHPEGVSQQAVRSVIERELEEKRREVSWLRGMVDRLTETIATYSHQSSGSTYNLFGDVKNLTDSGAINYREATQPNSPANIQPTQQFIDLLNPWLKESQQRPLSTNPEQQINFLQQALLKKAEVDPTFQTALLQLEPNQFQSLPPVIANAIQRAITQLCNNTGN